jgi:hypothetical protein
MVDTPYNRQGLLAVMGTPVEERESYRDDSIRHPLADAFSSLMKASYPSTSFTICQARL